MNSSNTGFNEKEPPHKLLLDTIPTNMAITLRRKEPPHKLLLDTIQNDMNLVEFQ